MPTLFWDFDGPDAAGTAKHFKEHLDGFLGVNALGGCVTRVDLPAASKAVVVCEAPPAWAGAIEKALRPKRREG
jgi:hypothetical protein